MAGDCSPSKWTRSVTWTARIGRALRKIHLDEPIRNIGTYMVVIEVTDDVTATIKTMVVAA